MKKLLCMLFVLCFSCTAALAEVPEVGSIVTYGRYEQDNVLDNGMEPIEWIVLDTRDGAAFLLSKYCLETRQFYPKRVPMYWGKSTLREWMNGEFLNTAFTAEEQERILTTAVENHNPHGMRGGSDDTMDKIYLLSRMECLHYMPEQADRVAYATKYCEAQGAWMNDDGSGSCRWWLRTPGARNLDTFGVRLDGRITAYGMQDVDWRSNTVRPVMWLDYSAE